MTRCGRGAVPTALGVLTLVAGGARAGVPDWTVSVLVKQGDTFGEYGTVSNINDVSVNDDGSWLVDVTLTGGSASGALIRDGVVWLAVGDLIDPDKAQVTALTNILKSLNNAGDVAFRPSLSGTPNSGIYRNLTPLLVQGQVSGSDRFSPGTPYIGFFRARVNDSGRVFAIATVNDPGLTGTVHRALVWLDVDPKTGDVTEDVLFRKFDPIPGAEAGVEFDDAGTDAARFAINNSSDAFFVASFLNATTATNAAIFVNDQMVVRKGDPAPIEGETFNNISTSTRGHMNASRQYVFHGTISGQPSGSNTFLIVGDGNRRNDNAIFFRQGDPAPEVAGETIIGFGTGAQPRITDAGRVVWYGQLSGAAATNHGLFVDDRLVLRRGDTIPDHGVLTTVGGTTSTSNGIVKAFSTSNSGQHVIVRVVFDAGPRAALLVSFDSKCGPADLNCDGLVNVQDLLLLLADWGDCPKGKGLGTCLGDIDGDGVVGFSDLSILLANWS